MGLASLRRAKFQVGDRAFSWYVTDGENGRSWGPILVVTSNDRRFSVLYPEGQSDPAYVVVMGRDFPGLADAGGAWIRLRCPQFGDRMVNPSDFVRRLITWCLDPDKTIVRVDDRGRPIGSS